MQGLYHPTNIFWKMGSMPSSVQANNYLFEGPTNSSHIHILLNQKIKLMKQWNIFICKTLSLAWCNKITNSLQWSVEWPTSSNVTTIYTEH